jgi:hypothetical protein
MRWKSPSDRTQMIILSPIILPVAILVLPIFGLMVGLEKLRNWACPQRDWHSWYAWRPVHVYLGANTIEREWIWLERCNRAGSCAYGWDYRPLTPQENDHAG